MSRDSVAGSGTRTRPYSGSRASTERTSFERPSNDLRQVRRCRREVHPHRARQQNHHQRPNSRASAPTHAAGSALTSPASTWTPPGSGGQGRGLAMRSRP